MPAKFRFFDNIKRSVAKSITYRTVIIASDLIIIYALTHRYDVTIGLTILTNVASTVLYYLHERVWNHIHWGRRGS